MLLVREGGIQNLVLLLLFFFFSSFILNVFGPLLAPTENTSDLGRILAG